MRRGGLNPMKKTLLLFSLLGCLLAGGAALGQTITSFTPLSAKPGDAVTITGTGFNTTAANNIVFFGATRATVTAATATSITATVPTGATYAPISVLNTATVKIASSRVNFHPVYTPTKTGITTDDFLAKIDFTTGTTPYSIAIGDLDGDGKPDLAVTNTASNTVSVFRNTGSSGSITAGSFATKVDFTTGTDPSSVAIGDLNGDGKPDLAVTNFVSNTVSVFRNTSSAIGSISFAAKIDFLTGVNPHSVAIGDVDGDGKPELAVANYSSNISVLPNTGTISSLSFGDQRNFDAGNQSLSIAIGDLNGDGKPDLAVANGSSNTVSVLQNTSPSGGGIFSFYPRVNFTTGSRPFSVAIGDLNGDGKPELATANRNSSTVSVFRNNGTSSSSGNITVGSFADKIDFTTGDNPSSVAIGDVDGDGKLDLAAANNGTGAYSASVFRNTGTAAGTISFATKIDVTTGTEPRSIAIGDLDGDGKPDLVTANGNSNNVSVLRNADIVLPTISSFSPLSAKPGDAVTITGTGFNTTPANNIVFFGATKATVTAATATSITATVPTGATYAPITVLNTTLVRMASSRANFNPIYAPAKTNITTTDFWANINFTTGNNPQSVAIGDLDGDGKPDLVTANSSGTGANSVSVLRNTGSSGSMAAGSFAAKVDLTTGTNPSSVAIGDVDGDGKPDLVVANSGLSANSVSVFRNTSTAAGSISFAAKIDFATGTYPNSVAIGDLDGDGKPDLAIANNSSNTVSVLRNTGTAAGTVSFAAKIDFTTGTSPWSVAIGDLDGDGKPDLAVANYSSNSISVLRNTGTAGSITTSSFAAKIDLTTAANPYSVALGDLDGDGKPELVTANSGTGANSVSVLRNTGTAAGSVSFAAKTDFTTGAGPWSVAIGDVDGDGKPDLVTANLGSDNLSVLRNTGSSGTVNFAAKTDFSTGVGPSSVAIGDLDGDGKPDLAVANAGANSVSVLRNADDIVVPTISSFSPLSAKPGDAVTITGTGFNTTPANNIVFFGATRATLTAATATSITATVPTGATYAPITVLNTATARMASSMANFHPIYAPVKTGITPTDFAAKTDFTTGAGPWPVAIGDLDGDGKSDLVVPNSSLLNSISVLRNTGSSGSIEAGSFATKIDLTTGDNPYSVAIGDVDGDGKLDLVTINRGFGVNSISVLRNTSTAGSISFAAKIDFTTGTSSWSVAIGDFDGDGKPDLVVANDGANTVSVFRNTGTASSISFAAKTDFATGEGPTLVAIGDLDGDGKPDLATANGNSNSVSVLRNNISGFGNVSFAAKVDFTTGTAPYSVAIGDLDGDGKPDLATANYSSNSVSVLRNTGTAGNIATGSFAAKIDFATGAGPRSVAIGDLDGDGRPDLAMANYNVNTVSVLRNTGTAGSITTSSFAAKTDLTVGTSPISVAIGDLDGDGKPDLATAYYSAMSVLRNSDIVVPPAITSFTPLSAKPGDAVTITGTGFNTTPANNIVFFGATRATVTAATATSITATVPTGATYAPITVLNTATVKMASSRANFHPVYAPAKTDITTADFLTKIDFSSGGSPNSVALGDLDGDGKPDLVVANSNSGRVSVLRNTGNSGSITASSFAAKIDFITGAGTRSVAIGDLDGDGKPELAVANFDANTLSVLRNTGSSGSISFATQIDFATGTKPTSVAIGDLDGDGKPDLAVANWNSSSVSVFRNTGTADSIGTISFAAKTDFITATGPYSVAIGDLDGDGKPDLAAANLNANNVSVLRNTGTPGGIAAISFAAKTDFTTGTAPYSLAIGDLDGDGKPDLATANSGTGANSVSVLRNTGSSGSVSFATKADFTTGAGPWSVTIGDLDGDGKPDLAVNNRTSNSVSVLRNTGSSGSVSFAAKIDVTTGNAPSSVAIGDLDGDGKPELVTGNYGTNSVSVLRNADISGPMITTTGTPTAFTACAGSASTQQSFTVSGSNLTANITVTAPTGFEVSTTSGSGFGSSLTLTQSGGSVATTTIYVRMAATATGTPSGNVAVASTGATTRNVAVSGTVNVCTTSTLTLGTGTNSTNCNGNGSIAFTSTGITAGTQTLSYTKNTVATTATVTVAANGTFTLTGLGAGVYANFAIGTTTATGNRTLTATPALSENVTTNITTGTVVVAAQQSITATNRVSTANVTYRAGSSVTLSPGFQATGNTFQATIGSGGCN